MKSKFWNKHYKKFTVNKPSFFAKFCISRYLSTSDILIELGCGNGRDGIAISKSVCKYIGFDICNDAVNSFNQFLDCHKRISNTNMSVYCKDFTAQDFNKFIDNGKRLVFYSRFSMHSISRIEEKLRDFLENKLVQILLRVDASACLKCTEDDKKIILQIQLIKSLYDSNHKLVDLYLQQIEKLEKRIETDYGRRIRTFEE